MKLGVGDEIVYRAYGIGRVVERKPVSASSASTHETVVLAMVDGLTVTLPLDRALSELRPLATKADLDRLREALRADPVVSEGQWLSRRRDTMAKLVGGDAVGLAEIVCEAAERQRRLQEAGKGTQISAGEREVVVKARQLLADEIAQARGSSREDADSWIEDQLEHGR